MRKRVLLLGLILVAACGESPPASVDDPALLVPNGAVAFATFERLDALEAGVLELGQETLRFPMHRGMFTEGLGSQFLNPGLAGVARDRPLALAARLGAGPFGRNALWIVPVEDEAAFRAAVEGDPRWARRSKTAELRFLAGHALYSEDAAFARAAVVRASRPAWILGETPGAARLHVDTARVLGRQGGEIERGLDGAARAFSVPGLDGPAGKFMAAYRDLFLGGMRAIFTETTALSIGADLAGGELAMHIVFRAAPDTDLAAFTASSPARPLSRLGLLPGRGCLLGEFHLPVDARGALLGPLRELFTSEMDTESIGLLRRIAAAYDGGAFSFGFADGLSLAGVLHVTDPEAVDGLVEETVERTESIMEGLVRSIAPGANPKDAGVRFDLRREEDFRHGDVPVRALGLDLVLPEGVTMPPRFVETRRLLIGGDRLAIDVATVGETAVVAAGAGAPAIVGDCLDRLAEPAPIPAKVTAALADCPEELNAFLLVDLGEFVRMMTRMQELGMGDRKASDETRALLASAPADLTMSLYLALTGDTGRAGLRFNIGSMLEYQRAMRRAREPK